MEKRDITTIERLFQELKRLLNEQREDLEALHDLRTAGRRAEPPTDLNLLSLIQRWSTLPEDIRRQIIELAKQPEDRPGMEKK